MHLHPDGSTNENYTQVAVEVSVTFEICCTGSLAMSVSHILCFSAVLFVLCLCGSAIRCTGLYGHSTVYSDWDGRVDWEINTGAHRATRRMKNKVKKKGMFEVVGWEKIWENRIRGQDVVVDRAGGSEMKSEVQTFDWVYSSSMRLLV